MAFESRSVGAPWVALAGLALAAFIFNTSEFMPVGLLTDIAASFSLTEAQAGWMISVYAWAVMLLSVPLMVLGSRIEMKRLMLVVIATFLAGQVASAAAPSFPLLVAARLLVAAAHAVFWSIATPVACRIAGERHAATAMSMVVTGSSIAMILGLPLGRVIGLALGWRMTFACVAAVAVCVGLLLAARLPRLDAGEPFRIAQLPTLGRNRALVALYATTILMACGYYTCYSYIEPFLGQVAHLDEGVITVALTAFGGAGILGSLAFSRLYDGHRVAFARTMVALVAASIWGLSVGAASPAAVFALLAIWGFGATAFNVAFQAEVIRVTDEASSPVAMSIFSGLFNLGIGCGSFFGGAAVDAWGTASVSPAGGAIALAGVVCCFVLMGASARATRSA